MNQERANELNLEKAKENGNLPMNPVVSDFYHNGLTKREYMATQLMAAGLASGRCSLEESVDFAIKGVDLLLIELNKTR